MGQYISKSTVMSEIKRRISLFKKEKKTEKWSAGASQMNVISLGARIAMLEEVLSFLNTLEVEEIETPVIPKHSYFEHIYHCGSEPMWKIGDILAVYELYSDREGECVYGKITDIKMDENEDWLYTFENGEKLYENMLISDEAYKKN